MNSLSLRRFAFVAGALAITAAPAFALSEASPVTPLFGGYWADFLKHWTGVVKQQNGVIMVALALGALSLFIITRGKWKK
ncbi:MAG TPA: hypothetical protein VGI99_06250 [Gemmataceae bacterium]|jgi:amino acid transporter